MSDIGLGLALLCLVLAIAFLVSVVLFRLLPYVRDLLVDLWDRMTGGLSHPNPEAEEEARFLDEWWGDQNPGKPGNPPNPLTSDIERGKSRHIG